MSDGNKESGKGIFKYLDSSDFEKTKIARWIISLVFVAFAFINGFSFSSFLLIFAGLLTMPIKAPEYLLSQLKPLTVLIVAVSIVLVGLIFTPDIFKGQDDSYISQSNTQTVNNGSVSSGGTPNGSTSGSGQNSGDNSGSEKEENGADSTDNKDDERGGSTEGEGNTLNDSENTDRGNENYILNTNSKKFHDPECRYADSIKEENREEYCGLRQDLIDDGYEPCKTCAP